LFALASLLRTDVRSCYAQVQVLERLGREQKPSKIQEKALPLLLQNPLVLPKERFPQK
jgi:hypothetical protein